MKERNSNIELLRIFAILGIIVLHYNNEDIGGGFAQVAQGSINEYILVALESLFICGVNLFMLISGYFLIESKSISLIKPLQLIVQVIAFSEGAYVLFVILGREQLSIKGIIKEAMPLNYFAILYCVVYVMSPLINKAMKNISGKTLTFFMIAVMVILALEPTMVDIMSQITGDEYMGLSAIGMYGSGRGYTLVNFVLMYMIGAYLRIKDCHLSVGRAVLALLAILAAIVAWSRLDTTTAWEYCNPLIILEAVVLFLLFKNFKINSKVVNAFAKGTFTVFLIHTAFLPYLRIAQAVTWNPFLMLVHICGCGIVIYLMCWVVYFVYDKVTAPVYKLLGKLKLFKKIEIN